ncbi:MAG: hypothetical protein HZB55_07945 [Deltaproteobacteria bacterium]|nr:hypothetical protein [Deltaproteobacteria bacterium]
MAKPQDPGKTPAFTFKQGQYLAFLDRYTRQKGYPPSEGDVQEYFGVSAPSVHQMIVTLETKGLISRVPRQARTIRVLVPREQLPALEATEASVARSAPRRMWVRETLPDGSPQRRPSTSAARSLTPLRKAEIQRQADEFVARELSPAAVQPPPPDPKWNYAVDLFTKWHGRYFSFVTKYACPGPYATVPFFDHAFARLESVGADRFNLAYHRHTGQWWEPQRGITFEECLQAIRGEPLLQP